MAWTSPKTWASNDILTASDMNTYVRDNLSETCPATVTAAGDMTYADVANSMGGKLVKGTAGTMMAMNDGETAPSWFDPQFSYTGTGVDDSVTAASTWETFRTITLTDPNRDVTICSLGMLTIINETGAGNYEVRARIRMSIDGGSTYSNGIPDNNTSLAASEQGTMTPFWTNVAQTPTGDILVELQGWVESITGGTGMNVDNSALTAWLAPA